VSEFNTDISAALSSDGPISKERVLAWIAAAADSDLSTLSKLYQLTDEGYYRIQPELGREPTCALVQRYLLGCIREGVTDNEEIEERYEAAMSLHVWFRHLLEMEGTSAVLAGAASEVTTLYLENGEDVRDAIETGFLEHALETAALRPYFEHWASDPRLQSAWDRALEWGKAHADYMVGLLQQLRQQMGNDAAPQCLAVTPTQPTS
jgi:hypothetical protein